MAMTTSMTIPNTDRVYTPSNQAMLLSAATVLAIFIWLFWSFLERQVRFAIEFQADWGHTLVIPFIAGWFVWLNRERILSAPLKPSITGLAVTFIGILWFAAASIGPILLRHHNIAGMGVGLTIFGIVLAFCGWRAMRWMWFPVLYLIVFSQTVSDRLLELITFELQGIATVGGEIGLSLIGYDIAREGHTLNIYYNEQIVPINIAEACSGMRMLVAFLALGVAMAYRGLDTWWQRTILVIMAVPTAIFVNILRVITLGILATMDSGFAAGDFHSMVGMLWLLPAFFIYLGIMWILRQSILDEESPSDAAVPEAPLSVRFDRRVVSVFVGCVLILGIGTVAISAGANALEVYLKSEPVPLRRSLSVVPSSLGSWRSVRDTQLDAAMIEQLGTSSYLTRMYVNSENQSRPPLQIHVAYYTDQIDAIPHVPDRCLVAAGLTQRTPDPVNVPIDGILETWIDDPIYELDGTPYPIATIEDSLLGEQVEVRMPVGRPLVRHMEFFDPRRPDRRLHAGYFFIANGRWKPTPSGVKLAAFTGGDRHAYYCKVQIIADGDVGYNQDAFLGDIEPFLSGMLPEIMRSIADWAEVTSVPDPGQSE
ncbi:MAG: exosortase [Phycisphaerales bacterium]|jgi:exosortase|nr:exosortase [Phycisphaerales bacterium]MDP7519261.1 exosortase [Phycisphaerales bacterium]MDP7573943.1 exosortase [Phycisphaerales bacterium]